MNEPIHLAAEAPASLEVSQSFEAFYDAESRTLFRRLWLVTGNRAEAEELMQDAFLKVWERWEQVGAMEDPVGYLYRTAMNLFRKRYRRAVLAIRRSLGSTPTRDDFADADDRQDVRRDRSTRSTRIHAMAARWQAVRPDGSRPPSWSSSVSFSSRDLGHRRVKEGPSGYLLAARWFHDRCT